VPRRRASTYRGLIRGGPYARGKGAPYFAALASPGGQPGKHKDAAGLPEEEFDFSQPIEIDPGRVAVIAGALRESEYPDCAAEAVTAELARPAGERGIVGRFATDALGRYGWRP
jgi:hypothetical protein